MIISTKGGDDLRIDCDMEDALLIMKALLSYNGDNYPRGDVISERIENVIDDFHRKNRG